MNRIRVTGYLDANGHIEIDVPGELPPGTVMITIESLNTDDIAADTQWEASFAKSQDLLTHMAQEVRKAYQEGRTVELDPDELEQTDS